MDKFHYIICDDEVGKGLVSFDSVIPFQVGDYLSFSQDNLNLSDSLTVLCKVTRRGWDDYTEDATMTLFVKVIHSTPRGN